MKPFQTRTYGKWILAGEHSVLRGCPALAFPLMSRWLDLDYQPGTHGLEVEFRGPHGEELKLLFYGVIENAMARMGLQEPLQGKFVLTNSVPVGAGLGASAALCGAVARWCEAQGKVASQGVYEFAQRLEDLFHGESSGLDIAVSLFQKGLRFVRGGTQEAVPVKWWPKLYLSYSGQRGMTADCIQKVKRLIETDPQHASELDQQMRTAVETAQGALAKSPEIGEAELRAALNLSRDCFEQWDLTGGDVHTHMQALEKAGAIAVKPTGSGGGGYVLSLWKNDPPEDLGFTLERVLAPVQA